jgi:cation diffusion facilitator family transporter
MKSRFILISFLTGLVLSAIKFTAWGMTGSNAILTDALESVINIVASGFAFYSIYLSSQPRDFLHPYGHGKIEFFSAGFEGALIVLAGLFILIESLRNLFNPPQLEQLPLGSILIGLTALANGGLGWWLERKGREMTSITLEADGKHLISDSISSVVLVIGIVLISLTGYDWLDSVLSAGFAFIILLQGYRLVRRSVAGLMDEANLSTLGKIIEELNGQRHSEWIDIHNLRVQQYGADWHIDCHLTLPYYFSLQQVHTEVETVKTHLLDISEGQLEVFIHADPCLPPENCEACPYAACHVREAIFEKTLPRTIEHLVTDSKHFKAKKE